MEGFILGSGGGVATAKRATCSALLRDGEHALLIDAGTGVGHLVTAAHLLKGVTSLSVLLSHFHLDHIVGLAYLPSLALPEPAEILGPGRWLYGVATSTILERCLSAPFLAPGWGYDVIGSRITELASRSRSIGPFAIETRMQERHSHPTVAFRVNGQLAYCTDTAYDADTPSFAEGCRVLAHDAWHVSELRSACPTHTSAIDAAHLALRAGADTLVMIHIAPTAMDAELKAAASAIFERSVVGTDLLKLSFD